MTESQALHLLQEIGHWLVQAMLAGLSVFGIVKDRNANVVTATAPSMAAVYSVHKGAPALSNTLIGRAQAYSPNFPMPPHMVVPTEPAGAAVTTPATSAPTVPQGPSESGAVPPHV